jgi:hypothetical protein
MTLYRPTTLNKKHLGQFALHFLGSSLAKIARPGDHTCWKWRDLFMNVPPRRVLLARLIWGNLCIELSRLKRVIFDTGMYFWWLGVCTSEQYGGKEHNCQNVSWAPCDHGSTSRVVRKEQEHDLTTILTIPETIRSSPLSVKREHTQVSLDVVDIDELETDDDSDVIVLNDPTEFKGLFHKSGRNLYLMIW